MVLLLRLCNINMKASGTVLSRLSLTVAVILALLLQLCRGAEEDRPPSTAHEFLDEQERWAASAGGDTVVRRNTALPVLGYVTPWNPSGQQLVSDFRSKFDLVAPVWYTVLVSKPTSAAHKYKLSGGPPAPIDIDWAHDLQNPAEDDDDGSAKVKVVPRFQLDAWTQNDFADLLSNQTLWTALADVVVAEVEERGYDGVVFESAATYLLFEPVRELSERLHGLNKTLVVVLPPIRTAHSLTSTSNGAKRKPTKPSKTEEAQNRMILQSLPQLATVVDWFSIMTYDMSSAGGRTSGLTGADFPDHSPLRQAKRDNLRQPGPNTSPTWIAENLEAVLKAAAEPVPGSEKVGKHKQSMFGETSGEMQDMFGLDASNPFNYDEFSASEDKVVLEKTADARAKFLMGMPMYGYQYPVFFIDRTTGQGVDRVPARTKMQAQKAEQDRSALPFLRGPGEALTMTAITNLLKTHKQAHLTHDTLSMESWFDYTEKLPLDVPEDRQQYGVRPGDEIYWRVYIPTRTSMRKRLEALTSADDAQRQAGVSLWEVGQASETLLVDL